jgi:hypothetical protein
MQRFHEERSRSRFPARFNDPMVMASDGWRPIQAESKGAKSMRLIDLLERSEALEERARCCTANSPRRNATLSS